ncbi:MAG: YiiG family protein [Deltaproteobacteria bacterium]|jgi:hypothetical protein|nr:YiiG family protein [Deltaproteobacteria bacterium]
MVFSGRYFKILGLCAIIFLAFGCGEGGEKSSVEPSKSLGKAAQKSEKADSEPLESTKWNVYMDLLNAMPAVILAADNYKSVFGSNDNWLLPSEDFKLMHWMGYFSESEELEARFTQAQSAAVKEPVDKLDQSVNDLLNAAKPLWDSMKELTIYINTKQYSFDNMDKGNRLHKYIIGQVDKIRPLALAFDSTMSAEGAKKRLVDIASLKKAGLVILASMNDCLGKAEDIQKFFYDLGGGDANINEALKTDEFRVLRQSYLESFKALDAEYSPQKAKEQRVDPDVTEDFVEAASDYADKVSEIVESIDKKSEEDSKLLGVRDLEKIYGKMLNLYARAPYSSRDAEGVEVERSSEGAEPGHSSWGTTSN